MYMDSLRKLKDNNGAYIWQPAYQAGEPDRILVDIVMKDGVCWCHGYCIDE